MERLTRFYHASMYIVRCVWPFISLLSLSFGMRTQKHEGIYSGKLTQVKQKLQIADTHLGCGMRFFEDVFFFHIQFALRHGKS